MADEQPPPEENPFASPQAVNESKSVDTTNITTEQWFTAVMITAIGSIISCSTVCSVSLIGAAYVGLSDKYAPGLMGLLPVSVGLIVGFLIGRLLWLERVKLYSERNRAEDNKSRGDEPLG